jgi:hypothetical protein
MWPFRRCLHDWHVVDKTVFKSPYEQLGPEEFSRLRHAILAMFSSKVVLTVACKKCGDLRINTEEGPW